MIGKRICLVCVLLCVHAIAQGHDDVATVRQRWMDWALSVNTDVPRVVDTARQAMKAQSVDGCWADVQYDDAARSLWKADLHLERLNTLSTAAFALRRGGHPNTELEVAGERAVACWLRRDPQNPNWWWNEIGAPQELGRAALLLQPALNKEDIAGVGRVLRRSLWTRWTGQNLVWGTSIEVLRGLIENDAVVVQEGFERLFDEVRIAPAMTTDGKPGEGVESDGSFHQHGAQLYSGGYGYGFGVDVGRAVVLTWGTRFQVREEPMRVFAHFVLDGQQWMMRGDTFDYLARGREITREEGRRKIDHSDFQRVVSALAELDVPRKSEFARFANALHGGPETAGNRNFWNSDYMVHRRVSYAVSVRMFSTRMQNEEIVNGEGERSVHLADGASMLYLRGDEYRGIFPVWDWSMVPGATALHWLKDGRPQTGELKPVGQMGETDFVGGVSDGEYGAAVMDLKRGTLHAKKAWFFFDDEYVALGAGIRVEGDGPKVPVMTTVEQSRMQGKISKNTVKHGVTVAAHGDVGYVLQPGTNVMLESSGRSGRWSDIGTGRNDAVTVPIFLLAVDHGVSPQDATYAYTVLPIGGLAGAVREAESPRVKVLQNNSRMQVVESKKDAIVQGVFYQAGVVKTTLGMLKVTESCAVLLRRMDGRIRVAVANPRATAMKMDVLLDGNRLPVQLEGGTSGGRSVVQWLPETVR